MLKNFSKQHILSVGSRNFFEFPGHDHRITDYLSSSTSGSACVTDIPDILAQTEHGCRVLIDGHALREVLNSVDTYDGKLDLVQDLIRQVGIFPSAV